MMTVNGQIYVDGRALNETSDVELKDFIDLLDAVAKESKESQRFCGWLSGACKRY